MTTETPPTPEDAFAEVMRQPPAAPDAGQFFVNAAEARRLLERHVADPRSPFFGHPEVLARHDEAVALTVARHNLVEPVRETPAQRVERERAESFERAMTVNPNFAALLDGEASRVAAMRPDERAQARAETVERVGGAGEFARLMGLARSASQPSEFDPEIVGASAHLLRTLANRGSLLQRHAAEAERRRRR